MRYTSRDDRVYTFRNEAFDLLESDPRFRIIPGSGRVGAKMNFEINRLALWAMRHKLVGYIQPESLMKFDAYHTESADVVRVVGAVGSHFVIKGFFQYGHFREQPVRIKPRLIEAAKKSLASATKAKVTVAVHVRQTDYGSWPVYGIPGVLLPARWYRDRMNELRERLPSPTFIVFSDDIESTKTLRLGDDVIYFSESSAIEDFAVMALCDHAIISPSSFAWWAALTYPRADKVVMAPTYWAGFKRSAWFPTTILTEGIEYYPVP
jgi:hypothetical protein